MFDKTISIFLITLMGIHTQAQEKAKSISKNQMTVSWSFDDGKISFEMTAPTKGWIAIGFNESTGLTNTYLIMGSVTNGKAKVREHHVFKPGDYQSFAVLDEPESISEVTSTQSSESTTIRFSLPTSSFIQYTKTLKPGTQLTMLMAYSREKDFEHHSIMRTSINVKL